MNGFEFYDTGVITSAQASLSVLTDDMFSDHVTPYSPFSQFFNLQVNIRQLVKLLLNVINFAFAFTIIV